MSWFVLHDTVTGAPRSSGTVLPPGFVVPAGLTLVTLAQSPDLAANVWDAVTRAYVASPPTRPTIDPDNAWPLARKVIVEAFRNLTRAQKLAIAQQAGVDLVVDLGITP